MDARPRSQPPRPLPARPTNSRPVVLRPITTPQGAVSSSTTIIPGVGKVYDRLRPGQAARRRQIRFAIIAGAVVAALIITTIVLRAQPWARSAHGVVVSTQSSSHPTAFGEHDFVCSALPFARLAQTQMTTGEHALAHPWYLSVILAQWGVEGAWTVPGHAGYNWANVPALAGFPSIPGPTVPGAPATLAYAATAESGVAIYVTAIKSGSYDAVTTAYAAGADAQAVALGQSSWTASHYTDTGHAGSALLDTIHFYHLDRLDVRGASC